MSAGTLLQVSGAQRKKVLGAPFFKRVLGVQGAKPPGLAWSLSRPVTGGLAGEIGVDEAVQVTVHDGVDIAGLEGSAGVLDHGVGHKYVRADLAPHSIFI